MGVDDKAKNKAQEVKGQAKEGLGRATDDQELEAEGRTDQAKSDLKQAGGEGQGRLQGLTVPAG